MASGLGGTGGDASSLRSTQFQSPIRRSIEGGSIVAILLKNLARMEGESAGAYTSAIVRGGSGKRTALATKSLPLKLVMGSRMSFEFSGRRATPFLLRGQCEKIAPLWNCKGFSVGVVWVSVIASRSE